MVNIGIGFKGTKAPGKSVFTWQCNFRGTVPNIVCRVLYIIIPTKPLYLMDNKINYTRAFIVIKLKIKIIYIIKYFIY